MEDRQTIRKKHIKLAVTLVAIGGLILIAYYFFERYGLIEFFQSGEEIQAYVKGYGVWAPLAFLVLQIAQVIITPIPGNVTTIAGGLLFGFWPAFIISIIAVYIGSMVCFWLARKYGRPLVIKLVKEETVDKYLKELSTRQRLGLILIFLFPFFPDDTICLIAGLTPIATKEFFWLMALTRPWGILGSALLGANVITIPVLGWVIIAIATAAVFAAAMVWGPKIEEKVKSWYKHLKETI